MYSYEDRKKAVELYIKYDLSAADAVRELGFPSRKAMIRWHKEYQETGRCMRNLSNIPDIHLSRCKLLSIIVWNMGATLAGQSELLAIQQGGRLKSGSTNWFLETRKSALDVMLWYNFPKSRKRMRSLNCVRGKDQRP